eukprot:Phypoly_transcript_11340.p1 GENE.Phypoly_transcript_11340~~Phypoly_transcript_11340.p1  ORF type:complete len:295 (+),score=54.57 Phypoly_transcript_11340:165-1049(+)
MSKRKWKVYTTDELRDRFQPKPGSNAITNDDQKLVVPNLKRRNSAPPGMIHFPPGTFSTGGNQQNSHQPPNNAYLPSSPHQQHELVTHARGSPTQKSHPYPSRLEKRRASLPYIPPSTSLLGGSHSAAPPSIEAYLNHLQQIPIVHHDEQEEDLNNPPLSPSHSLPSFQSLLQTIREDADEEDSEIRDIEEHANSPKFPHHHPAHHGGGLQTSKTLPIMSSSSSSSSSSYKDMGRNKSPNEQQTYYQPQPFAFPSSQQPKEPSSPSSKFYKNNLSKSNENLPSLSRMSISDIIG